MSGHEAVSIGRWLRDACDVDAQVLRRIREAYASLATGDVDAFAEVLDDELHWRGIPRGWFRKHHPY
jgi:hypothetical protein